MKNTAQNTAKNVSLWTKHWLQHKFYTTALVLAIDIGLEGMGIVLRKGRRNLFEHSFLVPTPEAAPLEKRRGKRTFRHAKTSARRRDRKLRRWIVKHGLLTQANMRALWNKPNAFAHAFEHRHRAVMSDKPLASPEAVAVCLRHIIGLRGFDYHLTGGMNYPWGNNLEDSTQILQWAKHSCCPPSFCAGVLSRIQEEAEWATTASGEPSQKWHNVKAALEESARRYDDRPIERMLEAHVRQKGHPNLRERARNHNFPRELVWDHMLAICSRHRHYFTNADIPFDSAMEELKAILNYHRRTTAEAAKLWRRKTRNCPFAEHLHRQKQVLAPQIKCDLRSDARVRRFHLLVFLAERRVSTADNREINLTQEMVRAFLQDLEDDIQAMQTLGMAGTALTQEERPPGSQPMPRPEKPGKRAFEKRFGVKLAASKKDSPNEDFFIQLCDLVRPDLGSLRRRASICGESAEAYFRTATGQGATFKPDQIRKTLLQCGYYDLRKNLERGIGVYRQVEFLLGQRSHYNDDGTPRDIAGRQDNRPQHHGVLRKLFAGQLRLGGTTVDLSHELNGATVPDYVVIECAGEIPKNQRERDEQQRQNKASRARKKAILKKYGLTDDLSKSKIRRVLLFDQQANDENEGFCPLDGTSLGRDPLAHNLETSHIFSGNRGGIRMMDNLFVTTREKNAEQSDRTPYEWLGDSVDEHLSLMHWNKQKRAYFCWEDEECPDWDNTTRLAQLAKHLRQEIIHWLGIRRQCSDEKSVAKEVVRRIGTPDGYRTSICRESWAPQDQCPWLYQQATGRNGRRFWTKNRDNLRHHLWDAAILSHIPPGVGLNSAECGGIFFEERRNGTVQTKALPGLGPDLKALEEKNRDRCMVCKPRQTKSKQARYNATIFSPPDEEGRMWARESLAVHVAKKNQTLEQIKSHLNHPGRLQPLKTKNGKVVQLLREKDLQAWWEGAQALAVDRAGLRSLLVAVGVPDGQIPEAALAAAFRPKKNQKQYSPKRAFTAKTILRLIRQKCKVPEEQLPDSRVESFMEERLERATLRANNGVNGHPGQTILRVRVRQDAREFYAPHYGGGKGGRPIGFKPINNSSGVTYLRREIWSGQRWKMEGKRTMADTFYEHRLVPHPRHLATHKQVHKIKWRAEPLPEGMVLIGSLQVGDVLRVPLKKEKKNAADSIIAKRGEKPTLGHWFYRIGSLRRDGTVSMYLAEYNEPKVKEGEELTPARAQIARIFTLNCSNDRHLAWLLETTGRSIQPPAPPERQSEKQLSLPIQANGKRQQAKQSEAD